jgi:hypothetical protein
MALLFILGLHVLRDHHHAEQQRLEKGPADADLVDLLQIPDGVPAVVAGGHHQFGTGGQYLIPLDRQADIAFLAVAADAVEPPAAAAAEVVLLAGPHFPKSSAI